MIGAAFGVGSGEHRLSDIFISYSSADRPIAERVHDALTDAGYDVFWDREIPPGKDWDSWIRDKLTGARLAVVLWTKASVRSPNVRHEAIIAREAGKLLPVVAADLAPSDFPMGLLHVQALDIGRDEEGFEEARAQLLAEVEEMLGGAEAPEPKPIRPRRWRRRPWVVAATGLALTLILAAALTIAWPSLKFDPAAPPLSATELQSAADREGAARRRVTDAGTRFLATDLSDLSSSWVWGIAQGIAAAPDEDRLLTVRFFQRLETARQPSCNCYFAYNIPQSVSNSWVVIASARLRRSPPEPLIEVLLGAQSPEGWWSITLDASPDRGNAAVHATALATIALAETRRGGLVPPPLRARVDDALRRAVAWLNQGPAEGAQWADYPHNERPTRNLAFAAMASVAARIAGGPADGGAARAFAAALTDLPGIADSVASGAYVARTSGERYFDDYRHPIAPWTGLAAALAYTGADSPTKRRLRPLIRRWLESDLSDPRLLNYDWMSGETLFLRALAMRELGG